MRRLLSLAAAALLVAGVSGPAGATVVDWQGVLELELGAQGTAPGLGLTVGSGGTALVNLSGPVGTSVTGIGTIAFPGGAFATTLSVPVYNQAPIVNLALVVANAPITVAKDSPCTNFQHSAVGQGGMFLPAGSGAGAHGIFCADGPYAMFGTGGLVGNAFVGILGTPGNPFANLAVPLTQIGSGSFTVASNAILGLAVAGAGMGWLTGIGAVRYVSTTPGGNVTFTATLAETGSFTRPLSGTTARIRLVSPVSIQVAGAGALPLPSFARITATLFGLPVHTPEAGSLLLLGTGIAGLALYGHRRRSK